MEVTVNITAGNDTEGAKISSVLQQVLMPGKTDAQTVNLLRTYLVELLTLLHSVATGQNAQQSYNVVSREVTPLH